MNICFFIGKICSEVQFEFILNSKDISIVMFDIELSNRSIIKIKGYNEIADYCYSKLREGMIVKIEGYINHKMAIILENVDIV